MIMVPGDREPLIASTYVVDIQIPAPEKTLCYDREVQCAIIDSTMVKYLQTIKEEEEHENEMSQNYE